MPRMPLSELSESWGLTVIFAVFAFVFLFNEYKLGRLRLKLNYKNQMILSVGLVILGNILTEMFDHWIYRSGAFVFAGLLFILNPVVPGSLPVNQKTVFWTRVAGVILILIGVFTRVHV